MKSRLFLVWCIALTSFFVMPVRAAFTSLHVFGDSISSTTSNSPTGVWTNSFYGKRYCNGRVWVEVLAQEQEIPYVATNNVSFYGNYSDTLVKTVTNHVAPPDASTALYVIWVNNADMVSAAVNDANNLTKWTADINKSQTNHYRMITNLWSKGVRTLIMPNAVDLSTVPTFNAGIYANIIHQQCLAYNVAFASTLNQARIACPGLTIIVPDYCSLLANMLASPASYGLTNALYNNLSIDVLDDPTLTNRFMNGPGTNYIFWDWDSNPSALVQYIMACKAQQLISPVQISGLSQVNGSNRLDLINVPLGMNGYLQNATNLNQVGWTTVTNISGNAAAQTLFVATPPLPAGFGTGNSGGSGGSGGPPTPGSGTSNGSSSASATNDASLNVAAQFYRLQFPMNWVWP